MSYVSQNQEIKMQNITLCDNEENVTYTFQVTNDNYQRIVIENDLVLATELLQKHKDYEHLKAAYKVVLSKGHQKESCPSEEDLVVNLNVVQQEYSESEDIPNESIELVDSGEETRKDNSRLWTFESTKCLIVLCEKHGKEFETGIKKYVWNKIAKELGSKFGQTFTSQQCNTKFKGLTNMYKQVKKLNETSGNSFRAWEYFDLMNDILFAKPEINARATISSKSGLVVNETPTTKPKDILTSPSTPSTDTNNTSGNEEPGPSGTQTTPPYKSSFMKKRKINENVAERRHKEKLERQDRYLDILERLTTAVERSTFLFIYWW